MKRMPFLPTAIQTVLVLSLASYFSGRLPAQEAAEQPEAAAEATPAAEEEAQLDGGDIKLPLFDELQQPTLEELLNGPARDWIVLTNNEVIVSEPVTPRPNTLEQLQQAYAEKDKERRGKTGEELERWKLELEDLRYVYVIVPGEPPREFRVINTKIARIIHHEDHVLAKIDSLLAEKNIPSANELLVRFERQWPDWPGLIDRRYTLIQTDAALRIEAGNPEAALVLLEELHSQKPDFPGTADLAAQAVQQLVQSANADQDPLRGHHFLFRLEKVAPGHPVYEQLAAGYASQARDAMSKAQAAGQSGQHAEAATLADGAIALWPRVVELKPIHKSLTERFQRLRVGIVRLPGTPKATPFDADAELRAKRLSENRLFEIDDFRGGIPHYRTTYLDEWEPFDLGRRMRFTLTQTRQPWEAQPPLGAAAITAGLADQINPESPQFDERLAAYVRTVRLESPFEFSLTFDRVPSRIEPILRDATGGGFLESLKPSQEETPATDQPLQPVSAVADDEGDALLMGGFPVASTSETEVVYRRLREEPEGLPRYHISEIIEHLYPNHEKAYQALIQGDVWMLPDLPDWIMRRAQADRRLEKDFFIQKYGVPTTHVLQFNPKSRALGFRELRRSMLYSINREKLLYEIVLREKQLFDDQAKYDKLLKEHGANDERVLALQKSLRDRRATAHGRVVNTAFPTFSYANSPQLLPQGFDLSAAVAMTTAVSGQMGGQIPTLRFAVPPEPIPQEVATRLIAAWKRVGIDVVAVEPGTINAAGWDIAYRTLQMEEPIVELWPFLTVQDRARVEDLAPFPDWLKQELIAIDRTSDWNRAVQMIQTLHRHLWADVRFIPLWEIDGYVIYRKQIRGVPADPLHCYEQLDRWNLEAWYATETP